MISATVLHEVVSRKEFHVGLHWGLALAAVVAVAGGLSLWVFKRPAPIAGLIVPLAFANGVKHWVALPANVTEGLVLLALAGLISGLLASWWKPFALAGVVLAIPGAALLTSNSGLPNVGWVGPLVIATTVFGGAAVADFDRRYAKRGWPVVMLAVSVAGVYFTVPDTERALVLLGASVPLVLLGWPFALASLGSVGAYPAVGALAWTAAFEGRGRHTAIIGGVACLGLFVAEPLARLVQGLRPTALEALPKTWWMAIPVAVVHLALVFVASRIAGLRTEVSQAVLISAMGLVSAVAVLWAVQSELPTVAPRSLERGSRR
jgi:hypothetical protein